MKTTGRSVVLQKIFVALLAVGASSAARAQQPQGELLVAVEDSSGGRVAGAQVALAQEKSGFARTGTADSLGEVRFALLPPGRYEVAVEAGGFARKVMAVAVAVGGAPTVLIRLHLKGGKESVTVREREGSLTNQPVETSSNAIKTVIGAGDLDQTPLAARSFASIAIMAPFTAPVEPSDPTKARITAVSFGGSSGLNVDLSVDGGNNNDDYIGGFLQNYSPEAMQEFVVRTAQYGSDTANTNGGSVIISTKRGDDEWHGSLSYYYRGRDLNARNVLDNPEPNPKQPFSRQNGVATFGGPIKPGKLWFFSSYEYINENASVAYSDLSLGEFKALSQMAANGDLPGVNSIGTIPSAVQVPFRDTLFSTRLDWAQSSRVQWFVRGALDRSHTQNDLLQQGTLPSTGATTVSNYYNVLVNQQFQFGPSWLGSATLEASGFHHTKARTSTIGEGFDFPFTANFLTTSGRETFGDNQFATSITNFPVQRDQQKYQFRYDASRASGRHALRFGVNLIHEPVLRGALSVSPETLFSFPDNPSFYIANPGVLGTCSSAAPDAHCPAVTPAGPPTDGSFSQSVRRLGFYAEDSWRVTPSFTVNVGLRYDTTFGLFTASGRTQLQNPALGTLQALGIPLVSRAPHDYRKAFAPRLGVAWAPGGSSRTVIRAGAGLYYMDLLQNGWVNAFTALNTASPRCSKPDPVNPGPGCLASGQNGGQGALIDPNYHTPYTITASAGFEHAFENGWRLNVTYEHQTGMHQYRRYEYTEGFSLPAGAPNVSVFRSDNRAVYDGLAIQAQHRFSQRFELTANYVLARANTWGGTVGEISDYVNGVSNALNPFGRGDYGPSGEDIRHRFVLIGVLQLPWKFDASTLSQFESARPFTMFTPFDVNGDGVAQDRAVINGVQTSLDQFRGKPFYQVDFRVSRNIALGERVTLRPFVEFFNLFNRTNPGNNYLPDISALPTPVNDISNATAFCLNASCTQTRPINSINQLRVPAGALGDFFGLGTTVGIPFAAQIGLKLTF